MKPEILDAINKIAKHVVATVGELYFAPAGPLFAALQAHGASTNQCRSLLDGLVKKGYLIHDTDAHIYECTPAGRIFAGLPPKVPA